MRTALYLDTSAVLRAVLEEGTTPAMERAIASADTLLTSRLSLVEAARSLVRLRANRQVPEVQLADAARDLDLLWARCEVWEVTREVCDTAGEVAPGRPLRTLDALHLATYLLARRRIPNLELLTADRRLAEASGLVWEWRGA